tara:strand:- start:903 stop:1199 length:297 start_codon:yes stop_codon:yes gene_type:complete
MISIVTFGVGLAIGMYIVTQIEKSIDKNIMKYNNIKKILSKQIQNNVKTFWVYNEESKEFINIYKMYSNKYTIYTPEQLLNYINDILLQEVQDENKTT